MLDIWQQGLDVRGRKAISIVLLTTLKNEDSQQTLDKADANAAIASNEPETVAEWGSTDEQWLDVSGGESQADGAIGPLNSQCSFSAILRLEQKGDEEYENIDRISHLVGRASWAHITCIDISLQVVADHRLC